MDNWLIDYHFGEIIKPVPVDVLYRRAEKVGKCLEYGFVELQEKLLQDGVFRGEKNPAFLVGYSGKYDLTFLAETHSHIQVWSEVKDPHKREKEWKRQRSKERYERICIPNFRYEEYIQEIDDKFRYKTNKPAFSTAVMWFEIGSSYTNSPKVVYRCDNKELSEQNRQVVKDGTTRSILEIIDPHKYKKVNLKYIFDKIRFRPVTWPDF